MISSVQLSFYLVQCSKKPVCGNCRCHEEQTKHIPSKHMPPRCVRAFHPQLYRLDLQFFRYSRHPHQSVDKQRRDPQKISLPVWHDFMSKDRLDLLLKAVCLHIHKEKYAGSEKVDKTKKKSRSICMPVISQNLYVLITSSHPHHHGST